MRGAMVMAVSVGVCAVLMGGCAGNRREEPKAAERPVEPAPASAVSMPAVTPSPAPAAVPAPNPAPLEKPAAGDAASAAAMKPLIGEWFLIAMNGRPIGRVMRSAHPVLVVEASGFVGGNTGINQLSAQLDVSQAAAGGFVLGPIVMTQRAAMPPAMRREKEFTDALSAARRFEVTEGGLVLSAEGKPLLEFARWD